MSTETATVKQGDTIALSYSTRPKQDMNDWTCQIMVKINLSDAALLDFTLDTVSADTYSRIGSLDTTSLSPGTYLVLAQLDNATTSESKEVHNPIIVQQQGVY